MNSKKSLVANRRISGEVTAKLVIVALALDGKLFSKSLSSFFGIGAFSAALKSLDNEFAVLIKLPIFGVNACVSGMSATIAMQQNTKTKAILFIVTFS